MNDVDFLLTEEFAEYSEKIAVLHADKKVKAAEFKAVYEAYKAETARIEEEAKKLYEEWEKWKSGQSGGE